MIWLVKALRSARKRSACTSFVARVPQFFLKGISSQASDRLSAPDSVGDAEIPLDDAHKLFQKMTNGELSSALLNLEMAANETLVDAGTAVLRSPLMKYNILSTPVHAVIKRTAYSHFCAGETVEEAGKTLTRMWELGLKGILDFSVEDAHSESQCERNLNGFVTTIKQAAQLPPGAVSFACVKITALCPLHVLERASAVLRWQATNPSCHVPWLLPSLPVLSPASPRLVEEPPQLSVEEEGQLARSYGRLKQICDTCRAQNLALLIDAEYTDVEPAIDHLAFASALEYTGREGLPLVYATVQCYLKDSLPRLKIALGEARSRGVPIGFKLVRGAYLSRETQLAARRGVGSPVHATLEETHACYDSCAEVMMRAAKGGGASGGGSAAAVVLATHNYGSGRRAVTLSGSLGLARDDPQLHFAQLKGMADALSLGLSFGGFNVSKYLPYGPVADVMPYLIRRAEENRGMLGNTGLERKTIRNELGRRFRASLGI